MKFEQEFTQLNQTIGVRTFSFPEEEQGRRFLKTMHRLFFPKDETGAQSKVLWQQAEEILEQMLASLAPTQIVGGPCVVRRFWALLPMIYKQTIDDAYYILQEDPAAVSVAEIINTYPGFEVIWTYRISHLLYTLGVPDLPRRLSELAHSRTGVDIHPGATIASPFFIDHGTGIVIGETTVVGAQVKVYQGVTLGALSVRKEDAKIKRHPTIEPHSVLYAGSTILGGETQVGHHSVIGGNVWLTRSVVPYSRVYQSHQVIIKNARHRDVAFHI